MQFTFNIKIFSALLSFVLFFSTIAMAEDLNLKYDNEEHLYTGPFVTLVVKDEILENLPLSPIIIDSRTFVPAREVFEALGATVLWVEDTEQILVTYDETSVILQIDNNNAIVNGENVALDVTPKIIQVNGDVYGKTMIPVRFVGENLGFEVGWDEATATVTIDEKVEEVETLEPEIVIPEDEVTIPEDNDNSTENSEEIIEVEEEDNTAVAEPELPNIDIVQAVDVSPMELKQETNDKTTVSSVAMPTSTSNYISIKSNSKMSNVTKTLLYDNRLVLDIYNADLSSNINFEVPLNTNFSEFRISQFQTAPNSITRAVVQLKEGTNYYVQFSDDRTELIVGFEKNLINNATAYSNNNEDVIEISGKFSPEVVVEKTLSPNQLVIKLPNATLSTAVTLPINGKFISNVYSADLNGTPVIYADLKSDVQYTVSKEDNKTKITLGEVTYENITFIENKLIINGNSSIIDLNNISFEDDYLNNNFTITINKNIKDLIGFGTIQINNNKISKIDIVHTDTQTKLIFKTNTYIAVVSNQDDTNTFFEIKSPKEVYDKIILIDAGHGFDDPGAQGNGLTEKNLTLAVSQKLKAKLEANTNIKIYMTRLEDTYPTLQERVIFANEVADLFFSIHINSNVSSKPSGTETYFYTHSNDNTVGITSEKVAEVVQTNLIYQLGTVDRGVKENDYYVIKYTNIPAILAELGFISNVSDASLLATDEFLDKCAYGLYLSVVEIFNSYAPIR